MLGLSGVSQVEQPFAILNTGARMPLVGLGTFKANATTTNEAVAAALANGYRCVCDREAAGFQARSLVQPNGQFCMPLRV